MSLRSRLLAAFATVVILLGMPLGYGLHRLHEVRGIAVALRSRHTEAFAALGTLRAGLAEIDRNARSYVIAPDPLFRAGMHEALARTLAGAALLEEVGFGASAATARATLDSLGATTMMLEALVEARRSREATAFFRASVQPLLDEIQVGVTHIGDAITRSSAEAAATAQALSARTVRSATVAGALALLLGVVVAIWATGVLARPLRRLQRSMAAVAGGELQPPEDLPYTRPDELGDLCRSFRAMTEQLAHLDRVRGEFLNVVSHDLKAPLNLINGCAELIEEEARHALGEDQRQLLESIRQHVRLLTERVNKLLSLSRLEAQAYPVHPEDIPVAAAFESVRRTFEPQARRQGIELQVIVDRSAPALVRVDPDCLYHEILGNLLSNAFKFTPTGGRIALQVWGEQAGGELHFTVEDSGIGIPTEELPLVFSKYHQVRKGRSDFGVGLGLAIARQVVDAHGGAIRAASPIGGGTIFHVTLPTTPIGVPLSNGLAAEARPHIGPKRAAAPERELRLLQGA